LAAPTEIGIKVQDEPQQIEDQGVIPQTDAQGNPVHVHPQLYITVEMTGEKPMDAESQVVMTQMEDPSQLGHLQQLGAEGDKLQDDGSPPSKKTKYARSHRITDRTTESRRGRLEFISKNYNYMTNISAFDKETLKKKFQVGIKAIEHDLALLRKQGPHAAIASVSPGAKPTKLRANRFTKSRKGSNPDDGMQSPNGAEAGEMLNTSEETLYSPDGSQETAVEDETLYDMNKDNPNDNSAEMGGLAQFALLLSKVEQLEKSSQQVQKLAEDNLNFQTQISALQAATDQMQQTMKQQNEVIQQVVAHLQMHHQLTLSNGQRLNNQLS